MKAFDLACSTPWAIRPETLQVILEIAAREREFDPEAVAARIGRRLENAQAAQNREGVAVIPVEGPLFRYANMFVRISGATSIDILARDFTAALEDPAVRAIVLAIDSPGGEVNGTNELAEMVYSARGRKPIAAYVAFDGASAAYWIASAADVVVVDATAQVGSIGVVATVPDPEKEGARGIQFVSSQSPDKRLDPRSEAGAGKIQATVDALADVFVAAVARNRGVPEAKVLSDFGMGWVLVGQQAVDSGLADRVGSLEGVIAELANRPAPARTITNWAASAAERSNPMGLKERIMAVLAGDSEEEAAEEPKAIVARAVAPAVIAAEGIKPPEPDPRIAALESEVARLNAARISAEATGFADTEIAAGRAFPAERESLVALYSQAATDDASHGAIAGGEGASRVSGLRAAYAARPAHKLTRELIPNGQGPAALLNQRETEAAGADKPPTPEREAQLLALSGLGQDVIRARNGNKN